MPSTAQRQSPNGAWGLPKECPSSLDPSNAPPAYTIDRTNADLVFTVHVGDVVIFIGTRTGSTVTAEGGGTANISAAAFAPSASLCGVGASDDAEFFAVARRPGSTTVYFPAPRQPTAVAEVVVIAGKPPSAVPSIVLAMLGLTGVACFAVIGPIARRRRPGDDLLRADHSHR